MLRWLKAFVEGSNPTSAVCACVKFPCSALSAQRYEVELYKQWEEAWTLKKQFGCLSVKKKNPDFYSSEFSLVAVDLCSYIQFLSLMAISWGFEFQLCSVRRLHVCRMLYEFPLRAHIVKRQALRLRWL